MFINLKRVSQAPLHDVIWPFPNWALLLIQSYFDKIDKCPYLQGTYSIFQGPPCLGPLPPWYWCWDLHCQSACRSPPWNHLPCTEAANLHFQAPPKKKMTNYTQQSNLRLLNHASSRVVFKNRKKRCSNITGLVSHWERADWNLPSHWQMLCCFVNMRTYQPVYPVTIDLGKDEWGVIGEVDLTLLDGLDRSRATLHHA